MTKLRPEQAIIVEGRDDVRAVQEACDALIIPTHGYGISAATWQLIEKAYNEKGIIVLTDPDYAGKEIRRRISERFPDAIHASVAREDAEDRDDIGIENARPEVIAEALKKALALAGKKETKTEEEKTYAGMSDMTALGLAAADGAAELRTRVCKELGIAYANASAMMKELRGFGIDIDELKKAVEKCK